MHRDHVDSAIRCLLSHIRTTTGLWKRQQTIIV